VFQIRRLPGQNGHWEEAWWRQYGEVLYQQLEEVAQEAGVSIEELLWRLEERGIQDGLENN
jgi:hypothetical protein